MGLDFWVKTNSIGLICAASMILIYGIIFYRKEKNANATRLRLLMYSIAAFIWAFCYGLIAFCKADESASFFRTLGILGINCFLVLDIYFVTEISCLGRFHKSMVEIVSIIGYLFDFVVFSGDGIDVYYTIGGYRTWYGIDCMERAYHNTLIGISAACMALLGLNAYRTYRYKRQKSFLICFYIANLVLLACCMPDTFFIDTIAFPTSGFGAIGCTIIMLFGTQRFSALGVSLTSIFDQIYDSISDGILVFNEEKEIIYANPFGLHLLGVDHCKGKDITEYLHVEDALLEEYMMQAKQNTAETMHLDVLKTDVKCSARLSAVLDKYEEPYCYIMTLNDMTDELKMLANLKQANDVKSHFLTSVSHEIRTPINTVLGMNEMIRRRTEDEEIIAYASHIDRSGHQLLTIINDILDYSKVESGKLELFSLKYDVASLVMDNYASIKPKADDKGLEFVVKVNPSIPSWLYGDLVRINQILSNLFSNSIKYTDTGFLAFECDYDVIDEQNIQLILTVRDSGKGMKNVAASGLFESFTKIDEAQNSIEGIGLGLAITKSLVDLMGGKISVSSIYGVGSKFVVTIPQKIVELTPVGNLEERLKENDDLANVGQVTYTAPEAYILAVDDIQMNLLVIEELLKETKIHVDTATSGEEALKKCNAKEYHLILMDHMMPGVDGIECLHRIRTSETMNRNVPIIVLTANAIVGMRDEYLKEGFTDYLSKPIDGARLEEIIRRYLPENLVLG